MKQQDARVRGWHFLALAVWPPLLLYARYPGEALFSDFAIACVAILGGAALLFGALRLLTRNHYRATLLTSLCLLVFFSYSAVYDLASRVSNQLGVSFLSKPDGTLRHRYSILIAATVFTVALVWVLRTRRDLRPLTRFANIMAVVLVVLAGSPLAWHVLSRSSPSPDRAADNGGQVSSASDPDIYYIILDRYPSNETLEYFYKFDNEAFLADLKRKGFSVAEKSRANYARSCLSLASSLGMEYHSDGVRQGDVIRGLHRSHRVGEILKSRGYRYVHIGSWYQGTSSCSLADENIHPVERIRSEFMTALIGMTPLENAVLSLESDRHAEGALFQLEMLETVSATSGPKFVFAHLLLPHPPFVFDRDGNRLQAGDPLDDFAPESRALFLGQLEYLNATLLRLVDGILEESERPPVIILQADEGPWLRGVEVIRARRQQQRIRTGILNACYLPGMPADAVGPTMTPVNTFRLVLSHYMGMDLPPLEDRIYSWKGMLKPIEKDPGVYSFEDVTDRVHMPRDE